MYISYPKMLAATALISSTMIASQTFAHEYKVGDIVVDHPVARATPPGAKVGAGYLTVFNDGSTEDRLIGGSSDFAGKVSIHEMKMENGIMKMNAIKGGLVVPAGGTVKLKAGGNHIMFMKLKEGLEKGEKRKVTLTFEKAGSVEVVFNVKSIAETKASH